MGGSAAEILCALIVSIGLIGVIVAIADPEWETEDIKTIAIPANAKYRGLWKECQPDASAKVTCWAYQDYFLTLLPHVQAGRGFSIGALFLGLFSFILCAISISAANFSSRNSTVRDRLRLFGSVLALVAGISMIGGVAWYASVIMQEYYLDKISNSSKARVVPGRAIYIGFIAAAFFVFGGIIGACVSCRGEEEEESDQPRVFYRPDVSKEYV